LDFRKDTVEGKRENGKYNFLPPKMELIIKNKNKKRKQMK